MLSNKRNIFLIIFISICIIITCIAIYLTNEGIINFSNKIETQKDNNQNIKSDGLGIKSLEDKFSFNPIKIIEKNYHSGEKIKEEQWETYYPIEISYIQISGLTNTNIQNKINEKIKNTAFAQIDNNEIKEEKLKSVNIWTEEVGNFSNTLSIRIYKTFKKQNSDWKSKDDFVGLNFNLQTGEQIDFTELFTNDAGTRNIIAYSAYKSFAREYMEKLNWSEEDDTHWDGDMNKIDYSEVEDRVFKVLQNYNRNNKYTFCFDERNIYMFIENENITIPMRNFYNQIAIYNRYVQINNLYEQENTKQYYVFVPKDEEEVLYRRIEELQDNLFIDIVLLNWRDEDKKEVDEKKYIKKIDEKIEECKKYLNKNKNKAIVIAIYEELNNDEYGDVDNIYIAKATMEKEYYNNIYFNKVLEWEQTEHYGADIMGMNLITLLNEESEDNKNLKIEVEYPE